MDLKTRFLNVNGKIASWLLFVRKSPGASRADIANRSYMSLTDGGNSSIKALWEALIEESRVNGVEYSSAEIYVPEIHIPVPNESDRGFYELVFDCKGRGVKIQVDVKLKKNTWWNRWREYLSLGPDGHYRVTIRTRKFIREGEVEAQDHHNKEDLVSNWECGDPNPSIKILSFLAGKEMKEFLGLEVK